MRRVMIPNGGRDGCILLTDKGARSIPPLSRSVLRQLKAVGTLAQAAMDSSDTQRETGEITKLATRVANRVVGEIEAVIGPLDDEMSLVYQDAEGGVVCGSTGQAPTALDWPSPKVPQVRELISVGLLDESVVDFVNEATRAGIELRELLEDPNAVAARLGAEISHRGVEDLKAIAPSRLDAIKDPVSREVVEFFHKVAEDGRFLDSWVSRPYEVAKELDIRISDAALERVVAGSDLALPGGERMLIAIIIAIVVIVTQEGMFHMEQLRVFDRSGIQKF